MRRLAWIVLLLHAVPAAAQDIVIRTALRPDGPVVLGQKVELLVEVLFPDDMPHPPRVAAPEIAGAQVFRFESQALNISDRIGDTRYVGQRFEFDVYARRAGTLTVPPVSVTLLDRAGEPQGTRTGPGVSFQAAAPPGLDASGPIVVADAVTMTEQWQPADAAVRHPGDAFIRQVTRRVEGVPGLALANLSFDPPDGVRAYPDPPDIRDQVVRGEVTGIRLDRVTYVFEGAGHFVLPAISQPWWELDAKAPHTLTLPSRSVDVVATPATPRRRLSWIALPAAACAACAGLAVFLARRRIAGLWAAWRCRPSRRELLAFKGLRRACRTGDAAATYRAWQAWRAVRPTRSVPPALAAALRDLERRLFGGGGNWDGEDARQLLRAASAARALPRRHRSRTSLPPLNPTSHRPAQPGGGTAM